MQPTSSYVLEGRFFIIYHIFPLLMPSPSSSGSRAQGLVLNMQNSYESILHDDFFFLFFVVKLATSLNIHTAWWISNLCSQSRVLCCFYVNGRMYLIKCIQICYNLSVFRWYGSGTVVWSGDIILLCFSSQWLLWLWQTIC